MKKLILLSMFLSICFNDTIAQQKRAMFINGYSINCNTGWAVLPPKKQDKF